MILWKLYFSFLQIGLFCVGGGYASMPLIQEQVVNVHHWLTMQELINVFSISQLTPGPIGINAATFVGTRVAGIGGAIAATLGFVTPSIFIMVAFAKIIEKYGDIGVIRGILNGVRPAVIALILSAGVMFVTLALWNKEAPPFDYANTNLVELAFLLIVLAITMRFKIGIIKVLFVCGLIGVCLGYFGLMT